MYLACQVLCKNICMGHVVLSGYITWLGICVMCSEGVWRNCNEGSHCGVQGRGGWMIPNSMEQSPSWEASRYSAIQEIPALYGTWWFISVFRRVYHFFLFCGRWVLSMPSPPACKINFNVTLLSTHGSSNDLIVLGFLTKSLYAFFFSFMHTTYPIQLICHDFITQHICWGVQVLEVLIMRCLQHLITSSFIGPNIFLSTCNFVPHTVDETGSYT